jgi:hypothetical protein
VKVQFREHYTLTVKTKNSLVVWIMRRFLRNYCTYVLKYPAPYSRSKLCYFYRTDIPYREISQVESRHAFSLA